FFFQAEDGIRDLIVTGVQTCALPISIGVLLGLGRMSADSEIIALTALGIGRRRILLPVGVLALAGAVVTLTMTIWLGPLALRTRSEERRVGKEWRDGGCRGDE